MTSAGHIQSNRFRPILALLVVVASSLLLAVAVAQQSMMLAGGIVLLGMAVAALAWPEMVTLLVIAAFYSNAVAIAIQFHGVPFVAGAVVPLLLLLPLSHFLIIERQKLVFHPLLVPIILFHGVQLVSVIFAQDVDTAAGNLFQDVLEGLVLFFLITNVVRTPATLRRTIWTLLVVGALIGLLGFYQILTGSYGNNYGGFAQVSNAAFDTGQATLLGSVEQPRLAGSVGEQNRHAQVMLMLVPLGVFLAMGARSMTLRAAALAMASLVALGVATTFSRGAALAGAAMVLVMAVLRYVSLRHLAVAILVAGLVMGVALPQYSVRVLKLQGIVGLVSDEGTTQARPDSALQNRAVEMMAAALVFADHPLVGVGPGMFKYYYAEYAVKAGGSVEPGLTRQAHNLYLGIAADSGLLGLLFFFTIIVMLFRALTRTRRRLLERDPAMANLAAGFVLALVVYLVTGIGLHFAYVRFFWIIVALAAVTSTLGDQLADQAEQPPAAEENPSPIRVPARLHSRSRSIPTR